MGINMFVETKEIQRPRQRSRYKEEGVKESRGYKKE
jgi:hypothetical protein